jgi:V/A-type H+-transporting ATPase subunit I
MFTSRMIRLFAVVLDRDAEEATSELLKRGVMHFIHITRMKSEWSESLAAVNPQVPIAKIAEMRKRIELFLGQIGRTPKELGDIDVGGRKPLDLDARSKELDAVTGEQQGLRERQRVIQQEILKLEDIQRQVTLLGPEIQSLKPSQYSFLSIRYGSLPASRLGELDEEMGGMPSVTLKVGEENGLVRLLVISMKRDSERVEKTLRKAGWEESELPYQAGGVRDDIGRDLERKLDALRKEQSTIQEKSRALIERRSDDLDDLWAQLRVNELFYRVQTYFKRTARTVIFTGWLPSSRKKAVSEDLVRVTGGKCYLEWHEPAEPDAAEIAIEPPPVQFRNPRFLAPFQMLVANFGVPEYGTIDPTPFVMVIYLIMFGLMFADVGQGALLLLAGAFGVYLTRGKKGGKSGQAVERGGTGGEAGGRAVGGSGGRSSGGSGAGSAGSSGTWQNLSRLMVWCGAASIVGGILFGSTFGYTFFRPLWFDFHGIVRGHIRETGSLIHSIFNILGITVYFGITVIGIGLLFNWVNLAIKKRWIELFLDKGGVFGGWIYGGGVYVASYMVRHGYKEFPPFATLFFLVALPALLFVFKGPLHFLRERRESGKRFGFSTLMTFGMDWGVELLEIFSRYLSNTLSFMRVAGLGIAHVSLMAAFFEIAMMMSPAAGAGHSDGLTAAGLIVIVFGNILVIGLEGLSAGIQSLRLNYYEFFTKFFHGTGRLYSPISLKSRDD